HFHRSFKGGGAAYGYCASKSTYYYGYKLHLLINYRGFPLAYTLTSANTDDRAAAEELASEAKAAVLIGDKGYVGLNLQKYRNGRTKPQKRQKQEPPDTSKTDNI
ncbi:MAG: transposase, partial [Clostridiales bacterium]|nr:transposase [Clostridiales bacterium]